MNPASITLAIATIVMPSTADVLHDLYPQQAFEPVSGALDENAGRTVDAGG